MEPQAYNVLIKIHAQLTGDDKLSPSQLTYTIGLLETLLEIYKGDNEDIPSKSKSFFSSFGLKGEE